MGMRIHNLADYHQKYDMVYLDPPWPYWGDPNKQGAAGKEYPLMTEEEIYALPINHLLSNIGCAFIWATGPKLHLAIKAIDRWGLYFRNVAHVWVKTTKAGSIIHGMGPPCSYSKQNAEYILLAGKRMGGSAVLDIPQDIPQIVLAPQIRRLNGGKIVHSGKPEVFREILDYASAHHFGSNVKPWRKLEMFSRRGPRVDWDVWGNQAKEETETPEQIAQVELENESVVDKNDIDDNNGSGD